MDKLFDWAGWLFGISGIVLAIATFIWARQQSNKTENPSIELSAGPSRNGRVQMAQIRIRNNGQRPVRITSWLVGWGKKGTRVSDNMHASLPKILQEQEEHHFLVELSEHTVDALSMLGVRDSSKKVWELSDDEIEYFKRDAGEHSIPKHLLSGMHKDELPNDTSGQSVEIKARAHKLIGSPYMTLAVSIKNEGEDPILIHEPSFEWSYKAEPDQSNPKKGLRIQYTGGSIIFGHHEWDKRLPVGHTREYMLDSDYVPLLIDAVREKVDPDSLQFKIRTSRTAVWLEKEEGLPQAVLEVARSYAQSLGGRKGDKPLIPGSETGSDPVS